MTAKGATGVAKARASIGEADLRCLKTGDEARVERGLTLKGSLTGERRAPMADIAQRPR